MTDIVAKDALIVGISVVLHFLDHAPLLFLETANYHQDDHDKKDGNLNVEEKYQACIVLCKNAQSFEGYLQDMERVVNDPESTLAFFPGCPADTWD